MPESEVSSFRYGLVHETVREVDVALADGSVVTCSPDNEHADLFFGFPNSYGTLGYATRVRAKTVPVEPYVALRHERIADAQDFFAALARVVDSDVDFVDGVVFSRDEHIPMRAETRVLGRSAVPYGLSAGSFQQEDRARAQ